MYSEIMTTLCGIQTDDKVILAADSQITEDNLRTISTKTPKIVHVGKYLLGIVGDTRPGDILAYNWNPPAYKGADPIQWMGKKILPSILAAFKENGYDPYEATKDKDAGFDYLVSFNGNLFHIAVDLSFIQSDHGLYGLGTGGQFALGFLFGNLHRAYSQPEKYAKHAIEIASVLDVNTHEPVQLVTQERVY
jgi:ATP-dependent protease HslVU (ClpYQ) peptidase subunit